MSQFQILVPLDFKDEPQVIFEFFTKLSRENKAIEITLLHIVEFPVIPGNLPEHFDYSSEFFQRHTENCELKLKSLAAHSMFEGIPMKTALVTENFIGAGNAIAAFAENGNFDLVLLYSRHRKGINYFFSGSELLRIVGMCHVPMIVFSPERLPKFHRIAFATDFSEESAEVYQQLKPIAKWLGGRLLCFIVNTQTEFRDQRKFIRDRNQFINLIGAAEGLEISFYNADDVATGILQFTEDNVANFIALGTHGRRGISRLYYGSITEDIIKSTTYPLIVINLKKEVKKRKAKAENLKISEDPK